MFRLDYLTEFDVSLHIFCQIHTVVPRNSSKLLPFKLHQVEQSKYLSVCHTREFTTLALLHQVIYSTEHIHEGGSQHLLL